MLARRKAALAAIIFTTLVLLAVNIGWWWYYKSITTYLEQQLSHRLTGVAASAALHISAENVDQILIDDLDAYADLLLYLDSLSQIDSLSEASIIDLDFNYLVSTRTDLSEEGYLLATLNFDSLNQAVLGKPTPSQLYDIDGTFLKSAYAPLHDISNAVAAVFVAEAGAGYFDLLNNLRNNLFLLAGVSAGAVVILLVFYIIYNRRMAVAEEKIFRAGSQAALGRMVAVVSHEIKNPMMIIRAAGERIEKKYDDPEASFVIDEVSRLDGIVTGYLSFSRGDLSISREPIDLAALVKKILTEFKAQFEQRDVQLRQNIAKDLPSVMVDRVGIRQVIINLLLNALEAAAIEANKNVEKLVKIDLTHDVAAEKIEIQISNNGPGIKPSQRKKLFEPFYTTKVQGSGLGLYLSRRIIEQHNGTIEISDNIKGMTTFILKIPMGETDEPHSRH